MSETSRLHFQRVKGLGAILDVRDDREPGTEPDERKGDAKPRNPRDFDSIDGGIQFFCDGFCSSSSLVVCGLAFLVVGALPFPIVFCTFLPMN